MAINIFIVKEDLITTLVDCGGITIDDDFYYFHKVVNELSLPFTSTIDHAGVIVINPLQLKPLQEEINLLRLRHDINPEILDNIQDALNTVRPQERQYIKFMGD